MTAAEHPVPTADIVIVNWNTGRYLGDCLRSIAETDRSRLRVTRIVVVDNASTDDSLHGLTAAADPARRGPQHAQPRIRRRLQSGGGPGER